MLLTTTDTLPHAFTPLGVVQAGFVANPAHKALTSGFRHTERATESSVEWAEREIERRAVELGADAVIGLRVASLFGNNCMLMGTAVKLAARVEEIASR